MVVFHKHLDNDISAEHKRRIARGMTLTKIAAKHAWGATRSKRVRQEAKKGIYQVSTHS